MGRRTFSKEFKAAVVHDRIKKNLPNAIVAEKYGVAPCTINVWCTQAGTPAGTAYEDRHPWKKIDPLLGTMPDVDLAKLFGIKNYKVLGHRRKINEIEAFGRTYRRKEVYPSLTTQLMSRWKRPDGIDSYLEEIQA